MYSCHSQLLCADIETIECLLRPYDAHAHTLTIPNIGVTGDSGDPYTRGKLVHPTLTSHPLHTAQPARKIPGHTGFLTFATLNCKQFCL